MRQGGKNRSRGRNNGRKPHMPMRIQTFDSAGPDVRIRGNAWQVHERYLNLARDAAAAGDRVAAENFFQHADHYFRMLNLNGEGRPHQHGPHPQHGQHPQHPGGGGHPQGQQGQPQQGGPQGHPQHMGQPHMGQQPMGQAHMSPQQQHLAQPQNGADHEQDTDLPAPYRAAPHPAGE